MIQGRLDDHLGTFTVPTLPTIQARPEIHRMLEAGYGWAPIARSLNRRGVPTPSGRGRWWPDTARRHADADARQRYNDYQRRYKIRIRHG